MRNFVSIAVLAAMSLLATLGSVLPQGAAPRAERLSKGMLALRQALLDATSDFRVVVVATHPDDPYRALSLMLRRRWGCDVTVLLATRGEGGQNAIGAEQGEDLARIRTLEAVQAADELDVRLGFLDFADFGFSRSATEALDVWGGDRAYEALRDRIVELAPDLVLTIHGPLETHGQKAALVDLLARLADDPELEAARGFRIFRGVDEAREAPSVVVDYEFADVTAIDGYRAESFRILEWHRTQAPHALIEETVPRRLALKDISKDIDKDQSASLFGELQTLWDDDRVLDALLKAAQSHYDARKLRDELEALPRHPDLVRAIPLKDPVLQALACIEPLRSLRQSPDLPKRLQARLDRRIEALERATRIGALVAVDPVEASTEPARVLASDAPARFSFELRNGGPFEASVRAVSIAGLHELRLRIEAFEPCFAAAGQRARFSFDLAMSDDVALPVDGVDVPIVVELELRGAEVRRAVVVRATLAQRVAPRPSLRLSVVPEARYLVPRDGGRVRVSLEVEKPDDRPVDATLAMAGPPGMRFLPALGSEQVPLRIVMDATMRRLRLPLVVVVPPWTSAPARPRELRFELRGSQVDDASCRVELVPVDLRLPDGLRVGIVRGPDTTVEESLASLGVNVRALDPRDLARADLTEFDTIVVDSRALLRRREDLVPTIPHFLDYCRSGRHLVVFYHKPVEFARDEVGALLAPYPLVLGNERITREDAPVTMLLPQHALLTWPNRIVDADWDGWVQERGLYFPADYDERYQELLSIRELSMSGAMHAAQRSSLLFAEHGAGSYVYCALVLHRQLRNLHPGAARLLVNIVTPPGWERLR